MLCLACYDDRLAALFDTAACFGLYEVEKEEITPVGRLSLPNTDTAQKIAALAAHGVTYILCGALSRRDEQTLGEAEMPYRAWLCGTIDDVLHAFADDELDRLTMPGCGRFGHRGNGPGCGRGRCKGKGENHESGSDDQRCRRGNR